jgi:pimeloyl-ACP methyl ester carboxylesterase
MSIAERTVTVDGVRLQIREAGDGAPVLMINGIGAHTAMWGPLESVLDGFHLIEFDAPGTGRSASRPYPVTVPALAWLASQILDKVGVEKADVVGYSMGGIVAQQLAVSAPQRIRRLVLAATSCGWGGVPGEPRALLNVATPLRYWSPAFYRRTIGSMAGGRARRDLEWIDRHGELRRRYPPSVRGYFGQVLSLSAWSGLPLLPHIRQPTLVVTGDDDPLVPPANSLLLASRLPHARVVVAPGEGHLLLMDPESATLEPIREFFGAESLDAAPVWREAKVVSRDEARAAIASTRNQLQPWGAVSAVMRAVWPVPRRTEASVAAGRESGQRSLY